MFTTTSRQRIRRLECKGAAELPEDVRRLGIRSVIIGEEHTDVAAALILREIFRAKATDALYLEAFAAGRIGSVGAANAAMKRMPNGVHSWNPDKYMLVLEEALKNDVLVFGVDNRNRSNERRSRGWMRLLDSHVNPTLRNSFLFGMEHLSSVAGVASGDTDNAGDISRYLIGMGLVPRALILADQSVDKPAIERVNMTGGTDDTVYRYGPAGHIGASRQFMDLLRAERHAGESLEEARRALEEVRR